MTILRDVATRLAPQQQTSGFTYDEYVQQNSKNPKAPKGMRLNASRTSQRDAWYEGAGQVAMDRALGLSERPYDPYSGQRVASLSGNESMASGLARSAASRYQPQMQRLQSGFNPQALSTFMNPYVDEVLGARTRAIGNEFGRQSAALDKNAAAMNAFRSGRSDQARARLNLGRMRAIDEATGQTKAEAFDSAKDSYFKQGAQDLYSIGALSNASNSEISNLANTGANERSIDQANRDFDYGQHLERRDWDVNNLNNLIASIQGLNSTAGTTEMEYGKKPKKSTWGTILGIAGTAVGGIFGGPAGAKIGGALGGEIGGVIDG